MEIPWKTVENLALPQLPQLQRRNYRNYRNSKIGYIRGYSIVCSQARAMLPDAVALHHEAMPSSVRVEYLTHLRKNMTNLGCSGSEEGQCVSITVGTMFSGCEIVQKVHRALSQHWEEIYGIGIDFDYIFAAEKDTRKQRFLETQVQPKCLFVDAGDLGQAMAREATGKLVPVPGCDWLIGGFPCTSKSKQNNNRAQHAQCIDQGTGATGTGLVYMLNYARKHRPMMVTLENVPDLAGAAQGSEESDADIIVGRLKAMGYWTYHTVFDAIDYGSPATRKRWYLLALHGCRDDDRTLAALANRILMATRLKTGALPLDRFLALDENKRRQAMTDAGMRLEPLSATKLRAGPSDAVWKDERNQFYRLLGMTWPAQIDSSSEAVLNTSGLSERAQDCTCVCM